MMSESEELESIWDHLSAMRKTVIQMGIIVGLGFLTLLFLHQQVFQLIHLSIEKMVQQEGSVKMLVLFGPLEGVAVVFKVSFWLAIMLTTPLWGWVLFRFLAPGLRPIERSLYLFFLFGSLFAVLGALLVAWNFTLPLSNQYLYQFNSGIGNNLWGINQYLDYFLLLILGHSVAIEAIFILLFLVHKGVFSADWLKGKRRMMMVLAFIIGAILTPPDVLSQALLALPLIAGYEIAILYAKLRT